MSLKNYLNSIRYENGYTFLEKFSVITVSGKDSTSFLNGQLTSNITQMNDETFHLSSVLDISGRYIAHFILIKVNDHLFELVLSRDLSEATLERLDKYLISEDVTISFDNRKKYFALLGMLPTTLKGYSGRLYNENCLLVTKKPTDSIEIKKEDLNVLRFASGEPDYAIEIRSGDLITNSFLSEICISGNKGCYPGQETVSKIINNKGASLFPVCLVGQEKLPLGDLKVDNKKIGEVKNTITIAGLNYYYTLINRENRVEGKNIEIDSNNFQVKYFPLFKNDIESKTQDLYYDAIEEFKKDNEPVAIEMLKKAIALKPDFEDAYESLGVIYGREGENYKAIELMKKLAELNPKSVMAHTNLSLYYMKIGDKETAEHHKAEATIKQFEVLGDEAKRKNELKEKEQQEYAELMRKESMFKEVLEIDPDDALANYGLGEIEYKRKNYLSAQQYLDKAILSDPKYSVAYLLLAKVLKESLKTQEFKLLAEKGIEVATKNGDMMPANELQSLLNNL